jgi:hypothetical protein
MPGSLTAVTVTSWNLTRSSHPSPVAPCFPPNGTGSTSALPSSKGAASPWRGGITLLRWLKASLVTDARACLNSYLQQILSIEVLRASEHVPAFLGGLSPEANLPIGLTHFPFIPDTKAEKFWDAFSGDAAAGEETADMLPRPGHKKQNGSSCVVT